MECNDLKKLDNENEDQYIWRIGQEVDKGKYRWDDIKDIISKEIGLKEDEYRTESAYRKKYQNFRRAFDNIFSKLYQQSKDEISDIISDKMIELKIERAKTRGTTAELNRLINVIGRDKAIIEGIVHEIRNLPSITLPPLLPCADDNEKAYVLAYADPHYGANFSLKGLHGEIINEYNPDILERRMANLLSWIIKEIQKENISILNVYDLGDQIDGIIRISQLQNLKYGIIESTIRYSEFLSNWLNELSKYVHVRFQMVEGNHSQLRMLNCEKGTFEKENMTYIIKEFIKVRLENNCNFEIIDNETGFIFDNLVGYNIIGFHGETKNMKNKLLNLSKNYKVSINYLLAGHVHHAEIKEIGIDSGVINVPSIMGTDPYALNKLDVASNPGATFLIFEEGYGKTVEKYIKLQ